MTDLSEREPPCDITAEQNVLGAIMLAESVIPDVIGVLGKSCFHRSAHQTIYDVVLDLHGRGTSPDVTMVAAELVKRGELPRVGGHPYLVELISTVPTATNASHYAGIVAEMAERRRIIALGNRAIQRGHQLNVPIAEVREGIVADLDELTEADTSDPQAPHLPGLPTYPAASLVGPLRDLVTSGAATGLPAPYLGGAGLATLATVAGRATLRLSDTWIVRPVLWVPLLGPAGAGKTPSINAARKPLRELDSATAMDYIAEWEAWQAKPARERTEDGPPEDRRRLVDDATLEALALRLSSGDSVLGVDADELAEWLSGLSRYRSGGGSDRPRWLSLWSSQPWTVDRVSGRKLHIPCPVVTVCGGLQPHLVQLLGPEGDGMRPRWLPHPSPDLDLRWAPGDISPKWERVIKDLYEARQDRQWQLSSNATKAWNEARTRWKAGTRAAESSSVSAALAKADEQAARIALVLAESQDPGQLSGRDWIDEDTMGSAIVLVDYVMDVWRAMPEHGTLALSRRDEVLDAGVDELAAWLERRGGAVLKRDIQQAKAAGARDAATLNALLAKYEATYPGSVRQERTGRRGSAGVMVYAPRRGNAQSSSSQTPTPPETVGANSFEDRCPSESPEGTAGQSVASDHGLTVDTANSSPANSNESTVSGAHGDGDTRMRRSQ